MRKLNLLSAVFLLGILLSQVGFANGTYKYSSKPHLRIQTAQTVIDAIYVPVNVPVTDVRVGVYAKTVMYSSLRVTLTSPYGHQVLLKQESGNVGLTPMYGSLGSSRSMMLFRENGNPIGAQPNDRVIDPQQSLTVLNGVMSSGWWQISLQDEANASAIHPPQDGYLEEWVLMFNRQIIEPVVPFTPPVNIVFPGGASIRGQINGTTATLVNPNRAQVPNDNVSGNPGSQCINPGSDPAVVLGVNGDAFPIQISGHPGAMIGVDANGYPSGRFRITVTIETNYSQSTFSAAYTEDIAVYFGRVPDSPGFLPLPAPPGVGDPGFQLKVPSGWPTGNGTVGTLQGGGSALYGGVRLAACLSPNPGVDDYGYDRVTFDDYAVEQIANGLPPGPNGGFTGTLRGEQQLSSLNGLPVDGLYYLTVYDAFNDAQAGFGHIRVTYLQVEYIVGGGEISDPIRHQGLVGPLMGVPVPGTITGTPLGYLSDVVGVIPPYREHAKDQDPLLVFWATGKYYPKDATGTERIQAVDQNNNIPPSGTHYHGPYAYPGALDSDPLVAGTLVNADVLLIPEGDYNLRVNLITPRYDDDVTDNEYESADINVNPISISYHGEQIKNWSKFVQPENAGVTSVSTIGPGQGVANAFTLFKYPTTQVASVDYRLDKGLILTPKARVRVSIWSCANGFTGAPSTLVARSPYVSMNEYMDGNWRTFPIYPLDAVGDADLTAGGSVNLAPGTYVVTLDNADLQGNYVLLYPYTYGAIPALEERYEDYFFSDLFGPLGPYSTLGTRLGYYSGNTSNPPDAAWGTTNMTYSNFVFPFRVNMTNLNDFAVNYVRWSSQSAVNEAITVGQQATPSVSVTAASTQNGLTKDFNIYLGIYDGGNNLLYSDMVNVATQGGIDGYETLLIGLDPWTPPTGGIYKVKAYFTRNPDDQNPVNDMIEYDLYVQAQPVIAFDPDVDNKLLGELIETLSSRGVSPTLVNADVENLAKVKNSTIYVLGDVNKDMLASAVAEGNDVAFVYDRNDKIGRTIRNIDALYGIERARSVNYDEVAIAATIAIDPTAVPDEAPKAITIPELTSKEDVLKYLSTEAKIEAATSSFRKGTAESAFKSVLPVATGSKYGDITFVSTETSSLGIVYTVPSVRTPIGSRTDAVTPNAFALEQNYPNPFNPSTVISYTLPEASVVTLRIIDVLGREVSTLVSSTQDAGTYSVNWKGMDQNGIEMSSGNYFYRLDAVPTSGAAAFSSTKKMTLSK
ncbi:MAG: FlgD immunoglobulin-like domain containing protein [Bacteroidota bacterium]|nr:FlgD immunoglobulin-like domain containing protein [Bacteroidota bacterium]